MPFNTSTAVFSAHAHPYREETILRYRPLAGQPFTNLTWGQLEDRVVCFAAARLAMGFGPEDRPAILAFIRLKALYDPDR